MRSAGFFAAELLLALGCLNTARSVPAAAGVPLPTDTDGYVAVIEEHFPANAGLADLVIIKRHGETLSIISDSVDLMTGDEIFVKRRDAAIAVRMLADNTLIPVRKSAQPSQGDNADLTIKPAVLAGLHGGPLTLFKRILLGPDNTRSDSGVAGSRAIPSSTCYNEGGKTNEPIPFRIPILTASSSMIASGRRALFVSWLGGVPPFSVTLSVAETGKVVVNAPAIRNACATYLPPTDLAPGHYRLTLTDANHFREQEDELYVADSSPSAPSELREADLPDDARQIYTATWLAVLERGKWAFEAQQRVASMDCRSPAVQDWLEKWGGLPPCGDGEHASSR
jgi:hypothetical protein